ncbi:MAG: hypothetical protein ACLVAI_00480 [Anaerovoracaceae bacterium]
MERVSRNVKDGSIILFHNNAQHVLEYLPQVLDNLKNSGYEIVKINDLIYHENYHIDNNGIQISDGDTGETDGTDGTEAASSQDLPSGEPAVSDEAQAPQRSGTAQPQEGE